MRGKERRMERGKAKRKKSKEERMEQEGRTGRGGKGLFCGRKRRKIQILLNFEI